MNSNILTIFLSSVVTGQDIRHILPMLIATMDLTHIWNIVLVCAIVLVFKYSFHHTVFGVTRKIYNSLYYKMSSPMFEHNYTIGSHYYSSTSLTDGIAIVMREELKNSKIPYIMTTTSFDDINEFTFKNPTNDVELFPGLFISTLFIVKEKKEKEKETIKTFTYTVKSKSLDTINRFVELCGKKALNAYEEPSVRVVDKNSDENEFRNAIFKRVSDFNTTKSFSNMFFEGKEKLIAHLDRFVNKKDEYTRLGIPHTLGILLHGAPGTGKTSTIKAIAKYLNRGLCSVNYVGDKEFLYSIFRMIEKQIFVFEEIDCGSISGLVTKRLDQQDKKESNKEMSNIDLATTLIALNSKKDKDIIKDTEPKKQATMGEFLECLDGISEMPGRVIIFTTNHPEKLDPAIIRPGRIDIVIEFKNMRRVDILSLIHI